MCVSLMSALSRGTPTPGADIIVSGQGDTERECKGTVAGVAEGAADSHVESALRGTGGREQTSPTALQNRGPPLQVRGLPAPGPPSCRPVLLLRDKLSVLLLGPRQLVHP